MSKRNTQTVYTKEAPVRAVGEYVNLDLSFVKATDVEMRKELGVAGLDSMPAGYVAGWASTDSLDHYHDVIADGAFQRSITSKGLNGPRGIKLLNQHRADQPMGEIKVLEYRSGGLWIEAQMNLAVSYVKDAYEISKSIGGLNFSVGYRLVEGGFEFVDKGVDSLWLITEADLHEVSVVTFPGNDDAEMLFIKSGPNEDPFETVAEAEKALVASGFAKTRREANRFVRWIKGLSPEVDPPAPKQPEPPMLASFEKSMGSVSAKLAELQDTLSKT